MTSPQKRTKILHVITRLIGGGAEKNTWAIVTASNRELEQHDLFTGAESKADQLLLYQNTNVHVSKYLIRNINPIKDLLCLFELVYFIKKNHYDIVHTHLAKAGVLGRIAAKIAGVKTIVHTLHGSSFYEGQPKILFYTYRFIEKILTYFTTWSVFVGNDLLEWYKRHHIIKENKAFVVRSAIDVDKFLKVREVRKNGHCLPLRKSFGLEQNHFILATIATFEKRKCLDQVIQIASNLKKKGQLNKDIRFVLVGRGPEEENLKKLAFELNVRENVLFLGYQENIENIFTILDVFLMTSGWEGLPQVFVQANLVGAPILTFEVDGAKEMVQCGVNGYIFNRKDMASLENKIIELFEDSSSLGRLSHHPSFHLRVNEWRIEEIMKKMKMVYSLES